MDRPSVTIQSVFQNPVTIYLEPNCVNIVIKNNKIMYRLWVCGILAVVMGIILSIILSIIGKYCSKA